MIIGIYTLVGGNIYIHKLPLNSLYMPIINFIIGTTNLSTTIFLLRLLTLINLYTPIHKCILAYTSLLALITRISHKILTNTNKYSTIYKRLLLWTNLYTPIHKLCIDIYNFVDGNKWNDLQNIDKCKVIFDNV